MLFRMMLEDGDKRRLLLDTVELLHWPLVWHLVGRFFRFLRYQIDVFHLDCGCHGHLYYLGMLIISTVPALFSAVVPVSRSPINHLPLMEEARRHPPYWYHPHRSTMNLPIISTQSFHLVCLWLDHSESGPIRIPFAQTASSPRKHSRCMYHPSSLLRNGTRGGKKS